MFRASSIPRWWEDQLPYQHRRSDGFGYTPDPYVDPGVPDPGQPRALGAVPYVVDLDREAAAASGADFAAGAESATVDYDVS